jgi:hypothetical protein
LTQARVLRHVSSAALEACRRPRVAATRSALAEIRSDARAGNGTRRDGSRGAGLRMLRHLTEQDADRLDCIGDVLRRLYERAGYRVVETIAWDDRFKPIAWECNLHGSPDIYVMEYQP